MYNSRLSTLRPDRTIDAQLVQCRAKLLDRFHDPADLILDLGAE